MNKDRTERYIALITSHMAQFLPENPQLAAEVLRRLQCGLQPPSRWRGRHIWLHAAGATTAASLALFVDWMFNLL